MSEIRIFFNLSLRAVGEAIQHYLYFYGLFRLRFTMTNYKAISTSNNN